MSEWSKPFTPEEMEAIRRRARRENPSLEGFWEALKRLALNLPFAEDLVASYIAVKDPATAPHVRLMLVGALAYFILPFDVIPDFLPFLGFTDDMAVLAGTIAAVRGSITEDHRFEARRILGERRRERT